MNNTMLLATLGVVIGMFLMWIFMKMWGTSAKVAANRIKDDANKEEKSKKIVDYLTDQELTKNHARHISLDECEKMGLKIERLEDMNDDLQDSILTIHHTYMHTLANSPVIKIIENHDRKSMINSIAV